MSYISPRRLNLRHIIYILGIIGPGIITATVDNDAGGIATYSIAGAHFGYALIWSLIPVTILLIIVQEICARMGVVTGKGLADLMRENFGVKLTFFIMIGLVFANLSITVAQFAGIASVSGLFGLSKYILVPFCAFIVWILILKLNYKLLEKFFLLLVFFYVSYIVSGILAKPDWGIVAKETFVPAISFSASYLFVLVAIIGTTITPWMQFYIQSSIVEKGIKLKDWKYSKWDVIIGCIITDVIAFFIIVACASALFSNGIHINSAVDAAKALAPLAGKYAFLLFAVGFFVASLFGAFILPLSTSFYVCEAFGWESGVNKRFDQAKAFYILLTAIIIIAASVILIPKINLLKIIVVSQVINGVLLPFVLVPILILVNKKKVMGSYVNKRWQNIIAWVGSIFVIAASLAVVVTSF